jgi:hypothetical protein
MRAIGTDEEVKLDFDLDGARLVIFFLDFEPGGIVAEVGASELVIEEELDARHGLQLI